MDRGCDDLARLDQVGQQALVDRQIAFVLSAIADIMTLGKHPPHFRTEAERVREHLKHDVSVRGAIPGSAQRRKA